MYEYLYLFYPILFIAFIFGPLRSYPYVYALTTLFFSVGIFWLPNALPIAIVLWMTLVHLTFILLATKRPNVIEYADKFNSREMYGKSPYLGELEDQSKDMVELNKIYDEYNFNHDQKIDGLRKEKKRLSELNVQHKNVDIDDLLNEVINTHDGIQRLTKQIMTLSNSKHLNEPFETTQEEDENENEFEEDEDEDENEDNENLLDIEDLEMQKMMVTQAVHSSN